MHFEKVWIEQCRATRAIKRRFGAESALEYLIGEKLIMFANVAHEDPGFAKELPKFLAAVWNLFNRDSPFDSLRSFRAFSVRDGGADGTRAGKASPKGEADLPETGGADKTRTK